MNSATRIEKPFVKYSATNADFSAWTLSGLWKITEFSSFPQNQNALWYQNNASLGRYPKHGAYNYVQIAASDAAISPVIDLSGFVNPDGSGTLNNQFWTCYVRLWFRPNLVAPQLAGIGQAFERLKLSAIVDSVEHPLGEFDNQTQTTEYGAMKELSRVSPTLPGEFAKAILEIPTIRNAVLGDTVTIDGVVFEYVATPMALVEVAIGVDGSESFANLAAKINDVPSIEATASAKFNFLTLTADSMGPDGDLILLSETMTHGFWVDAATNLVGGVLPSTDLNSPDGVWWYEQIIAPNLEMQGVLLGSNVEFVLTLEVAETDQTDYGVGVAKFSVEILRSDVETNAFVRGGFGGLSPIEPTMPNELYRSWSNSRRWS
jgi:hypothetical protein